MSLKLFVLLALFLAATTVNALGVLDCKPENAKNETACKVLIATCGILSAPMKWTGTGCLVPKGPHQGERYHDGGCQCDKYCGFHCPKACKRDHQCRWDNKKNKCISKSTGLPGVPILSCFSTSPPPRDPNPNDD